MLRLVLLLLILPLAAHAQGTATLVADSVTVTGERVLTADGNVQVLYDGTTLSARAITYDGTTDRLDIAGPILIRAADGTILTADRATLDPRLENGILRGARLVLDRRLQLAAARIDRADGRFTQLTQSAVTSCRVCGTRAPLWSIRAARVIHDEVERQIYFEDATFRIRGVPVAWLPRLRLPDPTLGRATGLLIPQVRTTSQLGLGVKLPYFIRLGDSRDLTLTPYLSTQTRTLEARYRQAFLAGTLQVDGAIGTDTIRPGATRSYVFADGQFALPRDWQLSFRIEDVSDEAFLLDYGYSDADRLETALTLLRVGDDTLARFGIAHVDSLREDEIDARLPPVLGDAAWERRTAFASGVLTYGVSADAFARTGDGTGDAGRDMARVGGFGAWHGQWIWPRGIVAAADARLALDRFAVTDDPAADDGARAVPALGVTLRWPLARTDPGGVVNVIEPVVSLAWSGRFGAAPPNEDATLAEFDEGNLLSLTRFPGEDAREEGLSTAIGLGWTRTAPSGATATLAFGRLFQNEGQPGFSPTSGLSQRNGDWLLTGNLSLPDGVSLSGRALFDLGFDFDKTELRLDWSGARVDIGASYYWLPSDPTRDRPEPASEWALDADWQVSDRWTIALDARYDVARDTPTRAGFGVGWRNECVTVDVSLARRYTSSGEADPSTDIGFAVGLTGFSADRVGGAARGCDR